MSLLDVKHAKEALAWRLKEWGVEDHVALAASFIDDLVEKGWRMDANRELRPEIPKQHEACDHCGGFKDRCACRLERRDSQPDHQESAGADAALVRAQLAIARAQTCGCGVRRELCPTHSDEALKTIRAALRPTSEEDDHA